MGKGIYVKRRVLLTHAKELEQKLVDILYIANYPPVLDEALIREITSAISHIRSLIQELASIDTTEK